MRRPNIEKYFGKVATLEIICKNLNRGISTNQQRTIEQVSKKLSIEPTGKGEGAKQEFKIYGYATFRTGTRGRPIPHEAELTKIYHNFLFEVRDSKFDPFTKKLIRKDYNYVLSTQKLLSIFGFYNQKYCLNKEIFKYKISKSKKIRELYKELSPMKADVLAVINFYESKKDSLLSYLDQCNKWAERFKTFWVIVDDEVMPADSYYCVPTTYISWEKFFPYYIEERKKQIKNTDKIKDWHMKFIEEIEKNKRNPLHSINKYDSEKDPYIEIFIKYCYKHPPVNPRGKKRTPKDILPYAHGFILHRLPPSLERLDDDVVIAAAKEINSTTITELIDYSQKKNLNMKNVEYIIDKYIRI